MSQPAQEIERVHGLDPQPGNVERKQLTPRQRQVLEFIARFISEHGWPPTTREIMNAFGWTSPNAPASHMRAIVRKGWATRGRGARQITIVS